MESALFGSLVQVESQNSRLPSHPEKAVHRNRSNVSGGDPIELTNVSRPTMAFSGATALDLGMSRSASLSDDMGAVEVLPSIFDSKGNKLRLAACCSMGFLGGLNDSAAGALIPYMETHYGIGYGVVSLIFVGVALGFIMAAPCVASLQNRLGLAKVFGLGELLFIAGYIPIAATAPIPVIVISFFIVGFGCATNLAVYNVWLANHKEAATALGFVHGMYGVGGIVGPLIATSMVSNGVLWSRFYLVTMGVAALNMAFTILTFWKYEQETYIPQTAAETSPAGAQQLSAMLLAFKTRVVLVGAMFIFAYQGAEVSISGWVISFLIASRNGEPSRVGYVTSGFWAGITLGRFFLSPLGPRIGEKRFVYGLVVGSAIFELLVWLVPNVVGDAVAVAIVGLLLGPIYPAAAVVFTRNLSKKEQASGLAVISAFGSSGGAIAPFTTGILAQVVGTFVLHPIAIGLFAVMILCWYCIPTPRKRAE
ncbi:major facilitator superfamily domain-containing protein [Truncatella angustata]|uniref:Major facilitator superfamily domain-containing protein n=1 Tax=Truncatella angustata TaxID=152316 RepID=A0A9P8UDJ9_9PEZI|nr:major facilitator superfamily domain-containing protein [Truncatella angustata]KAH6647919.1 major facilitator superfamily domain-containing protein [Truncatella angustata]